MRRFVKALSFKRDKQDDSNSIQDAYSVNGALVTTRKGRKPSHSLRIKSFTSISSSTQAPASSPITSSPSTPQLSVNSDHPHSSSASSSAGSVEINPQTPDDEHMGSVPSTLRNKWNMWVVNKKTPTAAAKDLTQPLSKAWPDSPSISHAIRPSDVSPLLHRTADGEPKADYYDVLDDDMLTASENEAVSDAFDQPHSISVHRPSPATARENMRVLIESKLQPIPVSYPHASPSTGPLYPRSCNASTELSRKRSIRYNLFQKRLLRRIEQTPSDAMSFPYVVTSREPIPVDPLASLPAHVTVWPSKELQISAFSVGIRRWIKRHCFEDKNSEYLPSEEGVQVRRITGSSLGVAALEYSETLDILAYPDDYASDNSPAKTDVPVVTIVPPSSQLNSETASSSQLPSSPSHMSPSILVRNHVSAVPSPLRNDALSSTSNKEENGRLNTEAGTAPRLVRRGVHFAEDEDDALPLHIIRMKRKREEKARFLHSEQRRREIEARQASQAAEDERRRRELERMEKEKALQERKAKEDERMQRVYLEQVAAARVRRELNRAGASNGTTGSLPASSSSSGSLRDMDHTSKFRESRHGSGSLYDMPGSRRASTSPGSPPHSSPGSSRAPSDIGQPTGGKTYPVHHSTHSEDGLSGSRGKRDSAVAQGYLRPPAVRNPTYPTWPNNFLAPPVPSMPAMPPYRLPMDPSLSMDMPLLPPVPPFMMQQYPRRFSRQSSPGHSNSSSSPVGTSINSSSERDDQSRRIGSSSSPSPSSSWSSGFFAASPSGRHSIIPHSESRRASMPPHAPKGDRPEATPVPLASSRSARGRLQAMSQQQVQLPSPWTALPTQSGRLPMSMPLMRQEHGAHGTSHGRKPTFIL